jgi:uncharacterized membrane protein YedE/YeeE
MMPDLPDFVVRTLLGLVLGAALGFAARAGRFCSLGAIEDAVYAQDGRRLRAWLLAIAVAIAGVQLLESYADLDLSRSIYVGARIEWGGAVIGGLMFGFGMALVGTCGFGTLLRLGGGDFRALLTFLIMGLAAAMTLRGIAGLARISLLDPLSSTLPDGARQRLPALVGTSGTAATATALAIAVLLGTAAFWSKPFLKSPRTMATGAVIGLIVVLGWWATGVAAFDPLDVRRIESFSFVAPLADTLLYLMLASGLKPDFPVGAVLGVVAGAFIAAKLNKQFRWEAPDDARELKRHLVGALLMGSGGVAALGCTIGQGITGVSTLSVGSILALLSIALGARAGLYWLVESESRVFLR